MLNVACVKVGTRYGADYVNILFDMVRRNLPAGFPGRFVCFTDDATGLDPAIHVKPVPQDLATRGWWAKLWLFSPDAFTAGEGVLYFDLDTVITGPLDQIVKPGLWGNPCDLSILRDAYRPKGFQSSVMLWTTGLYACQRIWESWNEAGRPELPGGDQEWIEREQDWKAAILQSLLPGKFRSYKVECRASIPRGTSVVFFHGHPRPHEVTTGWVPEVWKIGGGSGLEFVVQSNTKDETLKANVESALKRNSWLTMHPKHEKTALIVGGGSSLKDTLFYIRGMQLNGCTVFATNNSYRYLTEHGIKPEAHVMVDARRENIEFVPDDATPKYYASQCHPDVLEKADDKLICWHAAQQCYADLINPHPSSAVQVGGGTTVGLRAIAIAYILGHREFRLFGFDSCYGESHHAYEQKLNDGERTVTVKAAGRSFICAPWMVSQAEEFKDLICAMVNMECMVTVYGEGLVQAMAEEMSKTIQEVDGLYWPSSDQETRQSVMFTLADLSKMIAHCPRNKVAVQAGGNVGVFPKELAKHFERVVTFEPDPINFECLKRNVTESNVAFYQAALGESAGQTSIEHNPVNPGASYLIQGEGITVRTIDSFELDECDFLQLDVEGFELKALKGAEQTLRRCSPVIVIEQKGLGDKYGDSDSVTTEWLNKLGYQKVGAIHRDVIYVRTH